ncbi:hypothetical protein [Streptacidiphilus sp. EB129]|uniref:hypothetical protein n=1 Tax=Streptacidiphilus sp. EB129 TaxID=3156262 RepID=UPI00351444CB
MKKATLQAAGTAVLGVALAAAAITPAFADGVGGSVSGIGADGLPVGGMTSATGGQTGAQQLLNPSSGSLHTATGAAQGLINTAAPAVQSATSAVPALKDVGTGNLTSVAPTRALPGPLSSVPVVGGLPGVQDGLGPVAQSLPASPLG